MKHIMKIFEFQKGKYNVGDYVLLDLERIRKYNRFNPTSDRSKSVNPSDNLSLIIKCGCDSADLMQEDFTYIVKFYNNRRYEIMEKEIIRLLTSEEINEYENKKEVSKSKYK